MSDVEQVQHNNTCTCTDNGQLVPIQGQILSLTNSIVTTAPTAIITTNSTMRNETKNDNSNSRATTIVTNTNTNTTTATANSNNTNTNSTYTTHKYIIQCIFMLLGIGILMPWNAFISATHYFTSRFCTTNTNTNTSTNTHTTNFVSIFAIVFNVASIVSLTLLLLLGKNNTNNKNNTNCFNTIKTTIHNILSKLYVKVCCYCCCVTATTVDTTVQSEQEQQYQQHQQRFQHQNNIRFTYQNMHSSSILTDDTENTITTDSLRSSTIGSSSIIRDSNNNDILQVLDTTTDEENSQLDKDNSWNQTLNDSPIIVQEQSLCIDNNNNDINNNNNIIDGTIVQSMISTDYFVIISLLIYVIVFLGQTIMVLVTDVQFITFNTFTIVSLILCGTCSVFIQSGIVATAGSFVQQNHNQQQQNTSSSDTNSDSNSNNSVGGTSTGTSSDDDDGGGGDIAMTPYLQGQALGGLVVSIANFLAASLTDPMEYQQTHCNNNNYNTNNSTNTTTTTTTSFDNSHTFFDINNNTTTSSSSSNSMRVLFQSRLNNNMDMKSVTQSIALSTQNAIANADNSLDIQSQQILQQQQQQQQTLCIPYTQIDWGVFLYFLAGTVALISCLFGYRYVKNYQRIVHDNNCMCDDTNDSIRNENNINTSPSTTGACINDSSTIQRTSCRRRRSAGSRKNNIYETIACNDICDESKTSMNHIIDDNSNNSNNTRSITHYLDQLDTSNDTTTTNNNENIYHHYIESQTNNSDDIINNDGIFINSVTVQPYQSLPLSTSPFSTIIYTPNSTDLAKSNSTISLVWHQIQCPTICIFLTFFVTLSLFPGLTSQFKSIYQCQHYEQHHDKQYRIVNDLYVPFTFVLFSIGDVFGRYIAAMPYYSTNMLSILSFQFLLTQHQRQQFTMSSILVIASMLRFIFFPLLLLCVTEHDNIRDNILLQEKNRYYIASDVYSIIVQFLLATTHGFLLSMAFVHTPSLLHVVSSQTDGNNITATSTNGVDNNKSNTTLTIMQESMSEILNLAVSFGLLCGSLFSYVVSQLPVA